MTFDRWQAPDRDSPDLGTYKAIFETGEQIGLLLEMEGQNGMSEAAVQAETGKELKRPRRWHLMFERMGLIFQDQDGNTQLTDLGRTIRNAKQDASHEFRRILARKIMHVLRKYQLRNPADQKEGQYPPGSDIHPYWAVWKAAVDLGGKLHWDELNRELMWVLRHDQLDQAIENIRTARLQANYDPRTGHGLRTRCYDQSTAPKNKTPEGQTRDHLTTPWFKRASCGEFLLTMPGSKGGGYWSIPPDLLDLVAEEVQIIPEYKEFNNEAEWFSYYGSLDELQEASSVPLRGPAGVISTVPLVIDPRIKRMVRVAISSAPAVLLVGPPGTGKTTLLTEVLNEIATDPSSYGFGRSWTAKWVTPEEGWAVRDLVGGETVDEKGRLRFRLGHVLEAIRRDQWLVLDEANRADMDKIFGGLLTWLAGHSVELGRASTDINAPVVALGWNDVESSICEGVERLEEESVGTAPIRFLAGKEWRLLGTYNALDAQRVFRLGHALGRRFVRIPIPAMSADEFRRALEAQEADVPASIRERVISLYATHLSRPSTMLGPALFFWIPQYIRQGLGLAGVSWTHLTSPTTQQDANGDDDTSTTPGDTAAAANTLNENLVSSLMAEAYLSAAGVWLTKLEDGDLTNLEEDTTAAGVLPTAEWTWIKKLLPSLG